jgi:hypothetical protein
MKWIDFITQVHQELVRGELFSDYQFNFNSEQELTQSIGIGLRKLFALSYNLSENCEELHNIVTFRRGPSQRDRVAYAKAKNDRWVFFHSVFFAPDILIRKEPGNISDTLAIEVKLLTEKSPSQSIATAIGQSLIYANKFGQSIAFLGVLRSANWGKYTLRLSEDTQEKALYESLKGMGVRVIIREVGLPI